MVTQCLCFTSFQLTAAEGSSELCLLFGITFIHVFSYILQDNRANFNKFGTKLTWAKGIQVGKLKIYALLQGQIRDIEQEMQKPH